jgi:hypothetical protein
MSLAVRKARFIPARCAASESSGIHAAARAVADCCGTIPTVSSLGLAAVAGWAKSSRLIRIAKIRLYG